MPLDPLQRLVGTDVYLIDQLLQGRVRPGARIVDVGAGSGRNLTWFLTSDEPYSVTVIEPNPEALMALGERLDALGVDVGQVSLHRATVEEARLEPRSFDLVISCAVLHFAENHGHFERMLRASWELVAPGGLFFARLASSIGIEQRVMPLGEGRHFLPDESERYLVDEQRILHLTRSLGGELQSPIKTTIVQGLRSMTTWVMARPHNEPAG